MTALRHLFYTTALAASLASLVVLPSAAPAWQIQSAPSAGPACASVTPDVWSSSYAPAGYVTGGGTTSSHVDTAGSNNLVVEIGTRCKQTGKYYFELTTITVPGSDIAFGLAGLAHDNGRTLGDMQLVGPIQDSIGYQFFSTNRNWRYAAIPGTLVGLVLPANGDVIGIAVDFGSGTGSIWIRNCTVAPATWYGSDANPADPATATNGYPFASPAGLPWYLAWASNQNGGTTEGATMNAAGPFTCTAPSGFSAWQ